MNRKYRLSTALDVDDVLLECTSYAVRLANQKYKFDPPLSIYEADKWGKQGKRIDVVYEFFADPEFYRTQPLIEGAQEFVRELCKRTEVFICTAIPVDFMGIRAKQITELFPEIPPDHIFMGASKDKIEVDILLDDALHNVLRSKAKYPILYRKPWNEQATGMLAVGNYGEFLRVVEEIADSYNVRPEQRLVDEPNIVVLVGPSGSGKSKIASAILKRSSRYEKLVSYTTKDPTAVEENAWYNYVSMEKFRGMCESGEVFQSTMYAGHGYGSKKSDVENILRSGKSVLATMDICGAMALKTHFKNVVTVYMQRDKRALLTNILRKNSTVEDKTNRIIAIDFENQNARICDYVVEFSAYEDAVTQLCNILRIE